MIPAPEMRAGMVIQLEGEAYRVVEAAAHAGTGKLSGFVHARLMRLDTGTETDRRFRLDEKLANLDLLKKDLEFSYQTGGEYYFMDPETFESIALPRHLIGPGARFLREGLKLPVEFLGEQPVAAHFPRTVDLRVTTTVPPTHATQTSTLKEAQVENGVSVWVPLFIAEGELIRIDVATGRYVERVRETRR